MHPILWPSPISFMTKPKNMGKKTGEVLVRVIVAVVLAAALTLAFAPDLAKPLLVKYYRSIYSPELVRPVYS